MDDFEVGVATASQTPYALTRFRVQGVGFRV